MAVKNKFEIAGKKYRPVEVTLSAYFELKKQGFRWNKAMPSLSDLARDIITIHPEMEVYTPRNRVYEYGIAVITKNGKAHRKPRYNKKPA